MTEDFKLIVVVKQKDHIEVNIAPHGVTLVANEPEECFTQHLHFLYKEFLKEYNRSQAIQVIAP
jgi:hypothetical protein